MAVASPVSDRRTVIALLLLTFATGLVDAVSVLFLGHVFVANMTGNVIFLGFWFVPHSTIDLGAAVVAFVCFVAGTVAGGRFARQLDHDVRLWLTVAMGAEVLMLALLSVLAGSGVLQYHGNGRLILIAGLAISFGSQAATARQFGIQELSTTVLTSTIVGLGVDSRLAGGSGQRAAGTIALRRGRHDAHRRRRGGKRVAVRGCAGDRTRGPHRRGKPLGLPLRRRLRALPDFNDAGGQVRDHASRRHVLRRGDVHRTEDRRRESGPRPAGVTGGTAYLVICQPFWPLAPL